MKNIKVFIAIFIAMIVCTVSMNRAHAEELGPANPDSTTKWETTPKVVDTSSNKLRLMESEPIIADISKWQGNIDWARASKKLDLAIIRTQHGSTDEDTYHKKNEAGAKKYGVPFGVYAYNLAVSSADARVEANDFYNRADKDAQFYVIDVEQNTSLSGESMRTITNAYIEQLRKKTDKKIGIYVAHHLYKNFNLDTSKADFVWIPRYSTSKPDYAYDLWQYTDKGRIDGINANVDLNRLNPNLTLVEFLNNTEDNNGESEETDDGDSEPASVHVNYYTTNPKQIVLNEDTAQYSNSSLDTSKKTASLKKGQVLETTALVNSTQGKKALKLTNGQFITANKKVAIKVSANIDSYYTKKPPYVILNKDSGAYSSTNFTNSTKNFNVKKNTILTIKDIEYTTTGIPRFKTVSGSYITANKSYVSPLTSKFKDYVITKPSYVKLKKNVNQYSSIDFTDTTKRSELKKDKVVSIKGIRFTTSGIPRLQLTNGLYITANRSCLIAY
ncbi:DUF5776 domain-containing protein [Rummeliibacillus pycnus]|uniref:DUF5776 domain-containing protein n=1 Tax=Rummeliibacillus pycnus TaxID=101070 RepID=UPI003D2773F6